MEILLLIFFVSIILVASQLHYAIPSNVQETESYSAVHLIIKLIFSSDSPQTKKKEEERKREFVAAT